MKLVIDGDMLAFKASSVCEKRSIQVTYLPNNTKKSFKTRDEFHGRNKKGGYLGEQNKTRSKPFLLEDFLIEDIQEAEPIKNVYKVMNDMVRKMCDKHFTNDYVIVVGEGECFRHNILLPKGQRYKDNRKDLLSPVHAKAAKKWLVDKKGAELVTGMETDDRLAMYAYEGHQLYLKSGNEADNPYLICCVDKDQFAHSGRYWNPFDNSEPFYVDGLGELFYEGDKLRGRGRKFTYLQLLTSDPVDNVFPKRLPDGSSVRYGEKSAFELLNPLQTDRECLQAVTRLYREWIPEPITYEAWNGETITDSWFTWFEKHFTLYHLWRWPDDIIIVGELLSNMNCLMKGG